MSCRRPFLSPGVTPSQALQQDTGRWMMVPNSLVSQDGSGCNKVGTSYAAFEYQTVMTLHSTRNSDSADIMQWLCYAVFRVFVQKLLCLWSPSEALGVLHFVFGHGRLPSKAHTTILLTG